MINNLPEVQPEEIKKVLNEKRKSYRQKADDLSKKKSGYKVKNKIPKASTQNIDAMKDQESKEKDKVGGINNFYESIFQKLSFLVNFLFFR